MDSSLRTKLDAFAGEADTLQEPIDVLAAMRLEKLVDLDPARIGKRARLTARELAVLRWASFGRQVREIGHELGLSAETVRSHLKKAQAKLGAHNRTHAVSEALRQQLFP